MATNLEKGGAATLNPVNGIPVVEALGLGGHKPTVQMQQGQDFSQMDPNQIALLLGTPGYGPSYNSNQKGSFQAGYNQLLNNLTPDQLLARYSNKNALQGQFNATTQDSQGYQAYQAFKSIIGRDPTSSELSSVIPYFQNGPQFGNAYVSQLKTQLQQNPNDPLNQGKAASFSPQIGQVFQSMLGRAPTQDELNHFGGLFATGNVDAYQLQDFLRGTPEYQTAQDTTFRQGLDTELQKSDLNFFDRAKQNVLSQFMQNGTQNSSALDSALTDLMGQISNNRSSFLANLSANQYQGNKDLALKNYQGSQNQYLQNQNYNRQNALNQQNYLTSRGNELSDYNTQAQAYQNYLNSQKPNNLFNYLNTGANLINSGTNLYRAGATGGWA